MRTFTSLGVMLSTAADEDSPLTPAIVRLTIGLLLRIRSQEVLV